MSPEEQQARAATTEFLLQSDDHWTAQLLSLAKRQQWFSPQVYGEQKDARRCYHAVQAELARRSNTLI